MKPIVVSLFQRYGFAIFATMLATWARIGLSPVLGERVPFAFYFLSVLLTAWIAGTGPAVVALAGGIVAAAHWIIAPHDSWWVPQPADQMALLVYGVVGAVAVLMFRRSAEEAVLLQRRATENEELSGRLQEADSRKDEFLALLAHELRNPLAPIRSGLAVLAHEPELTPAGREVRDVLQRQVDQLVRIVDDLFDVSRFLRGQLRMESTVVDLRNIVDLALSTVQPSVDELQHDVQFLRPCDPVFVQGDEVRLTQVVSNLLANAARYTPRNGRIRVLLDVIDGEARLEIRDNGIGISPQAREQIFNLFTQVNPSHTRDHGGLGLGLAIVRQILELHEGTVTVTSDGPGRGSCFAVTLQTVAADDLPREQSSLDHAPPEPGKPAQRILIVDDNQDAAQTLATLLNFEGFTTQTVGDGHAALDSADRFGPDVILLDIGMPGMDGYEVARRLRMRNLHRHCRIIAVTGWGHESDRLRSRDAGFDHHVVKPVELEELRRLIMHGDSASPGIDRRPQAPAVGH